MKVQIESQKMPAACGRFQAAIAAGASAAGGIIPQVVLTAACKSAECIDKPQKVKGIMDLCNAWLEAFKAAKK